MNLDKLIEAEAMFLHRYPGGFENEELKEVLAKRHNVGKLSEFATTALAKKNFLKVGGVLDDLVKIVSRSSMVSMFEKPKYRDFVNGLSRDERDYLAGAYRRMLHGTGTGARGFQDVVDVLAEGKIAKWSILTIHLYHLRSQSEVFVKPTTTKNVIRQFELDGLEYRPRPSWDFYARYRDAIDEMKAHVNPSLAPNNAAFTGFLMMTTAVDQ